MRFKPLLPLVLTIIFLVIMAAGCTSAKEENQGADKLKIGSLPIEDNLPLLVAEENGYFAEEKINLELVVLQSPVELQSAFQAGELDGMITDMLIAALLQSAGEDLKVTSLTLGATPEEGRFAILAAPGGDIKTVADLKGKSIGISNNSIIEYVTDGLLKAGGVNPAEVNKTTIAKIPVRLEMLLNNKIDAITVPDPHISYTVAHGARIVAEDTQGENLSQAVVVMTGKALSDKEDIIKRFYKAYAKAVEDINREPEKYRQLLVENVNIPTEIAATYTVQHYSKPQLPGEKEVNNIIEWLRAKDLLQQEISYQSLVKEGLY
ncbi:MAG TPA: ABC transporter substrate-binding protein [Peptococcaceae bacterium]|nr:ABC transporter substrate-binding protein [Peptococcaceae bacterium]